jgi:divalent metal cation (Fe/Co/Zn/Cd) transporter
MTEALPLERRQGLHRRALRLEYFTVGWNIIEAVVAIGAGLIAGSVALIGFGVDSGVEVISAVGLLWRLRKAGPTATVQEESTAERRALYIVAATFFLLAAYISYEAISALTGRKALCFKCLEAPPTHLRCSAGPPAASRWSPPGPGSSCS